MTLKHTPGPWKVSRADLTAQGFGYSRFIRTACKTPMDNAEHICHVCALDDAAEDVANARLISAAPDLLAALQSNLEYLELKAQGFAKQYPPDHCINLTVFRQLEQTRAAISKATGEQP